jgi:hypothetical protein
MNAFSSPRRSFVIAGFDRRSLHGAFGNADHGAAGDPSCHSVIASMGRNLL